MYQFQYRGPNGEQVSRVLSALIVGVASIVAAAIATDVDLLERVSYRYRLWRAYQADPGINYARLRLMKRQLQAGMFAEDTKPAEAGREQ